MDTYEIQVSSPSEETKIAIERFALTHPEVDFESIRSASGVEILTLVIENLPAIISAVTALIAVLKNSKTTVARNGKPISAEELTRP